MSPDKKGRSARKLAITRKLMTRSLQTTSREDRECDKEREDNPCKLGSHHQRDGTAKDEHRSVKREADEK